MGSDGRLPEKRPLEAYTYTSQYLLFAVTIILASIIFIWIYERPRLYKLIFKKSKQSTVFSRRESEEMQNGDGYSATKDIFYAEKPILDGSHKLDKST
ncbi:unnamed protein product [Colias eurytheme]|nr:unnamed protein product [Colias eurytheme]